MENTATITAPKKSFLGSLSGAAFLMATSAIGPGFITQTTIFTQQLFESFGFVILISIAFDILVQLNIWRIVGASKMHAPAIANAVLPGLGFVLILLVSLGGLVFNIGNIGGCGLALNTLLGLDVRNGAFISCVIAVVIFLNKEFGKSMDAFTKILGFIMIGLTLFTAIKSHPPIKEILYRSFFPRTFSSVAVITLVGGTVGGYISFAGAHRMLDAVKGTNINPKQIDRAATQGIIIASIMRVLLFLAAMGVVASGVLLLRDNPAAAVFQSSAGIIGLKLFGIVLWAAAITSVVGAAYTSVSFLQTIHPFIEAHRSWFIIVFIIISTLSFALIGNPVNVLVKAGAVNGFVLPLSLSIMLIACRKKSILQSYIHPLWLQIGGWIVVLLMTYMSVLIFTGF